MGDWAGLLRGIHGQRVNAEFLYNFFPELHDTDGEGVEYIPD